VIGSPGIVQRNIAMRETRISLPELGLVAGTRALFGAGIGLLLADHMSEDRRKVVGWTLVLVGAATTIPLAIDVLGKSRSADRLRQEEPSRDVAPVHAG